MEDQELEYGKEIEGQVLETKDARYKSRKFVAYVAGVVTSTGLCAFGKLSGSEWVTAVTFLTTIYIGGNVAQKKLKGG